MLSKRDKKEVQQKATFNTKIGVAFV